jgi:hypothetical protein
MSRNSKSVSEMIALLSIFIFLTAFSIKLLTINKSYMPKTYLDYKQNPQFFKKSRPTPKIMWFKH